MGKEKLKWLSNFQFRKGSVPHNKGKKSQGSNYSESKKPQTVRLSSELYDELVTITNNGQLMTVNDAEGRDSNMMILRPRGREPRTIDLYGYSEAAGSPESETYRLLHNKKTSELWNDSFKDRSHFCCSVLYQGL